MRVGILSWIIDMERAGIGNFTYNLIRCMLDMGKGDELHLIHYEHSDDEVYSMAHDVLVPRLPSLMKFAVGLPYAVMKSGIDVLHVPSHWYNQLTPFLLNRTKKVLTIHDLVPILLPETHTGITVMTWAPTLRLIAHRIDMIATDSHATKLDCMRHLGIPEERIRVVYCGVDPKYRPLEDREAILKDLEERYGIKKPFVLYVGTLEKRKNIPTLLRALYRLKKSGVCPLLVIAGRRGWKYDDIFDTIHELKLEHDVLFTGYVPEDDLVALYNAADLFVYPSLYEGFGLPPLEAMACGCPVITSNTSSLPEVVGDAGIMVDPHDVNALADAMERVLTDESLREDMRRRGLERAKRFSWQRSAREMWDIYEEVYHEG
ncbi:glycosyltransferase family 4 protein [Methermicoccus shengliensis]|nr:glycosyltransferase family 1 protein [Methermicoccus shengliensis]